MGTQVGGVENRSFVLEDYERSPSSTVRRVAGEVHRLLATPPPRKAAALQATWHVTDYEPTQRASIQAARKLAKKLSYLKGDTCPHCWLQRPHCICAQVRPLPLKHRLWIYAHHDEVLLAADTAKILLAAFPDTAKLVVGGLPNLEREMMHAVTANPNSFVLFPAEGATTFPALEQSLRASISGAAATDTGPSPDDASAVYDIIVLDGTWEQARKLNSKVGEHVARVVLEGALAATPAHTLRTHPDPIRRISTLEAVAMLLREMELPASSCAPLLAYLRLADAAYYRQTAHAESKAQQVAPEEAWEL